MEWGREVEREGMEREWGSEVNKKKRIGPVQGS